MKTPRAIPLVTSLLACASLALAGCASGGSTGSRNSSAHCCPSIAPVKPYPLDRCLVSDEPLAHARGYTFVLYGQSIKLCGKDCLAEFKQHRAKYLAKLRPTD